MRKALFLFAFAEMILFGAFAQYQSISVDTVYLVVYEDNALTFSGKSQYIATIDQGIGSDSGAVKVLMKLAKVSDIPSGDYRIRFEEIGHNLYRITDTNYVLEVKYGYIYSSYSYIMSVSGYSITLTQERM